MNLSTQVLRLSKRFRTYEPDLFAFVPEENRFSRLLQDAQRLEEKYPDPENRPPLFGVFLGVKDIFHAAGFPTRAGTALPPEILTGPEGDAVARLKAAGALIVGKTVTTQFAYFAPGPTRNPHNLAHTPGGSSSGSAAAVAVGLCDIALGTQTIGSINRPAAFCGVVGFKPTYDRIPRTGVIPLSPSVDHVGLFGKTVQLVEDAVRVCCDTWHPPTGELPKPVFGIPEGPYLARTEPEGLAYFHATVARLEQAGFTVRRVPVMPDFDAIAQAHNAIVAFDAARVHAAWYAAYPTLYHPKTVELLARGQQLSPAEYESALASRTHLRETLAEHMTAHSIDLWLSPSAPGPALRGLESTGNPVMNLPWTHAGLPTLTLPTGKNSKGLPLGLQLTSGWYKDEQLLHWAKNLANLL
ncbi:MAG: amidase [Anaerolineales bacterium]|nr:amidase [Anaerolineales bacterium]